MGMNSTERTHAYHARLAERGVKPVTLRLDTKLAAKLDEVQRLGGFRNRSEAAMAVLRKLDPEEYQAA